MEKELYTKIEIPESLLHIYKDMAVSPVYLLRNYALNMVQEKINKYGAEDRHFIKKYNCSFEEFKARVDAMENEENFEWEDDLMDWEFAVANIKSWEQKKENIDFK